MTVDGSGVDELVRRAIVFLERATDEYSGGEGESADRHGDAFADRSPRLPRSYHSGVIGRETTAWIYDCALVVLAFLAHGTSASLRRAVAVGDGLLALQEDDGRLRDSYSAQNGAVVSPASATGNQAWAGLAWLRLAAEMGTDAASADRSAAYRPAAYRAAAAGVAGWIVRTQATDLGFRGGRDALGATLPWKSTEHNADALALFRALGHDWREHADSAERFLQTMFVGDASGSGGHCLTGTLADGVTPNPRPLPLDAQVWPFLATGDIRLAGAVDWAAAHLLARDAGMLGVSYSDADRSRVWLEGTAHLALATSVRGGDALPLLGSVRLAQLSGHGTDGHGVIAASGDGLKTGFGDRLFASLHTGTTAWAVLAALGSNPLGGGPVV